MRRVGEALYLALAGISAVVMITLFGLYIGQTIWMP